MYSGVFSILRRYWAAYGGWRSLARSPYFHVAAVITALSYPLWCGRDPWWDTVVGVLPNLLGFTLGGFAIFIGFGDTKFRELLVQETPEDVEQGRIPLYEALCATFVHFIVVQVAALVFALLQKGLRLTVIDNSSWQQALGYLNPLAGAVGYLLFIYAVCSALAACMHVFRIAVNYADAVNQPLRAAVKKNTH